MSRLSKTLVVWMSGCAILAAAVARGDDWPQWMGANRNAKVVNFKAPATWPKELTARWKATIGAGDSTPALVKDRLYAFGRQGNEEVTTCLDAATGKEIWSDKYAAPAVTGAAARGHAGTRSSPLVVEGHVVTLGASGILTCLNADTGKREWQKNEFPSNVPRFFVAMSPIVVDGMVIAHLGGPGNAAVEAFDLKTGEVKWKWAADPPAYASPVLLTADGTKQIVTQTDTNIVSIGVADGKLLWQIPFAVSGMGYNAATPIVDGTTIIYTGQSRGTTAVKVEKKGDAFTATQLWKNPAVATQFNTPVLKDGLLYGLSDRGTFFCLKAASGETVWADATARGTNYCEIVDAGSVLLALTSSSDLFAYKPSEKGYEEVARIKVGAGATFAYPVVDGNKIYVRDNATLSQFVLE
jgi:outer membrane protein assembly factor BamB